VADDAIQREVLPIPDREYAGLISYDAKDPDAKFPPIRPLRPPAGAPNVLLVLLDDVGFGASSAFGGPVNTSWAVTAQIEVPDGGGLGKGGAAALYLDGQEIGSGRVERTEPIGFGYEYTDVGRDALSPVTADYPPGDTACTGTIKLIELESGDDSHDHLIDPARFVHFIMAKQ
jgi:hypothetical protein